MTVASDRVEVNSATNVYKISFSKWAVRTESYSNPFLFSSFLSVPMTGLCSGKNETYPKLVMTEPILILAVKMCNVHERVDVTGSVDKSSRAKGVNPEEKSLALETLSVLLLCFLRIRKLDWRESRNLCSTYIKPPARTEAFSPCLFRHSITLPSTAQR